WTILIPARNTETNFKLSWQEISVFESRGCLWRISSNSTNQSARPHPQAPGVQARTDKTQSPVASINALDVVCLSVHIVIDNYAPRKTRQFANLAKRSEIDCAGSDRCNAPGFTG